MRFSVQNKLLSLAAMIVIASSAAVAYAQSAPFDPNQAAGQLSDQVSGKFGTKDGIRQNAVNPLTTGGSQMTNISGTTSFNAPLVFCPASKKFLDVTIIPGNTGDISGVYVQQDTNFDGAFDYTYTVPVPVAGVCGNGVISCDAGTWNNCAYYKWVADSSGKVSLLKGSMQDLGGCYCINNSCGNNLVTAEINYVMSTLGGGVAGAIQAINPKWAVSNVATSDTTISYYGQRADQCTTYTAGSSGPSNPEQYYNQSAGTLAAAAALEQANQVATPTGYYYHLTSSVAAQNNPSEYKTCTIQDIAVVNTDKQAPTYIWQPWLDIGVTCYWGRDSVNGCSIAVSVDRNNDGAYDAPQDTFGRGCCWSAVESIDSVGRPVANDTVAAEQQTYKVSSSMTRQTVNSEVWWRVDGGGKGMDRDVTFYGVKWEKISPPICPGGYTLNSTDVMCYRDTLSDSVVDSCSSFEGNSDCTLQSETIDGVVTYSNFNPTGLTPLSSCKILTGALQTFNVCHDWWTKNRTYLCAVSSAYDLSAVKERTKNISNTVTTSGSSFSYQDKTLNSAGGWTYSSNTVAVNTTGGTSTCMTACKTRRPATNTQASLSGTTAQSNVSTGSWEFFYKTCSGSMCPAGAGEEVLISCQCINEFAEAATIMETMNQAGKDLICSDGTKQ